jgi:hypothetical protein
MAATMCLVTAFLDPRTSTSPRRGPDGSINQASDTSLQAIRHPGPVRTCPPA